MENNIKVSNNNIQIVDSYKIKSIKEMKKILSYIRGNYKSDVLKRSNFSLINEWRVHNLLYKLGLYKARTKDVDLDANQSFLMKVGYTVLSIFYF